MGSGTLKVAADLGRLELLYGTDMDKPLRVGIIGLSAERGWATAAHIPALHALSKAFAGFAYSVPIACGVCNGICLCQNR